MEAKQVELEMPELVQVGLEVGLLEASLQNMEVLTPVWTLSWPWLLEFHLKKRERDRFNLETHNQLQVNLLLVEHKLRLTSLW